VPNHRALRDSSQVGVLISCAIGMAACLLLTGGSMLVPGNTHWLSHTDLAQSYLGWAFFRESPWQWPPGGSPMYGIGLGGSVYYSDSIPLLAMPFKLASPWLPDVFQYFGVWLLACFVLQAVFAWKILSLESTSWLTRLTGCLFVVTAPPMLMRLTGHMALCGQWTILAALYLYLRPEPRRPASAWMALAVASILIHAYLFFMVAAIWAADLIRRHLASPRQEMTAGVRWKALLIEGMAMTSVALAAAWTGGLFLAAKGAAASGFGVYKMNLLGPIDGDSWSHVGLNFPQGPGEYEGFSYLGLGGIALLAIASIVRLLVKPREPSCTSRWWPLALVSSMLTLLAVTNHVGFGSRQWYVTLPSWIERPLAHSPIQSTGRLFWVPYYALLLGAMASLARRLRGEALAGLMLLFLALQWADLGPGLIHLDHTLQAAARTPVPAPLEDPFWNEAGKDYRVLREVPTRLAAPEWPVLARFALQHGMATDVVQLARVDRNRLRKVTDEQMQRLASGQPESGTLYVIQPAFVPTVRQHLRATDALFQLDGYIVLAPGWNRPVPAAAIDLRTTTAPLPERLHA